jgi:predicted phosphoadenosine phosphosulfate sulfurtransferase
LEKFGNCFKGAIIHKMIKKYTDQNVYEATQDRLRFIFEEFDNIIVSFSGGKDSGLLLNLVLDFQRKYYPGRTYVEIIYNVLA